MKNKLIKIFAAFLVIIPLFILWAFTYPALTDDKTLIADETLEEFFPLNAPTEKFEQIFSKHSKHYEEEFKVINEILDNPKILKEKKHEVDRLLKDIRDLTESNNFDIPHIRFNKLDKGLTGLGNVTTYFRFIQLCARNRIKDDLKAAKKISLILLTRSKCLVHYLITLASVGILANLDVDYPEFANYWKDSLINSLKCEYYLQKKYYHYKSGFLFQPNKSWNNHWKVYSKICKMIQDDKIENLKPLLEKIINNKYSFPITNLRGKIMFSYDLPTYKKFKNVVKNSKKLEDLINKRQKNTTN